MDAAEIDELNRAITGDYRRLSDEMRAFLGVECLDWCGFAAWSSHTVGASIGDVAHEDNAFHQLPRGGRFLTRGVRRYLQGGDAVGRLVDGNRAIHAEMRVVYEAIMSSDAEEEIEARVARVIEQSRGAMVHDEPTVLEWQSVTEAARCYLSTLEPECDTQRRHELMLAAAVHFSAFEQSRVDAMLDEFMFAATRRFRSRWLSWVPGPLGDPARVTPMEKFCTWFFTRFLTILVTARGPLHLGKRFEVPPPADYSSGANPLNEPREREALDALQRYGADPNPDVWDWSEFDQRMRVIAAYFRAYQHIPDMVDFDRLPQPPAVPPAPPR